MKNLLFKLLVAWSTISATNAQVSEKKPVYFSNELLLGNYGLGVDFNLNYITDNLYSFRIGVSGVTRWAKSTPDDYYGGIGGLLVGSYPNEQMGSLQMQVGKVFNLVKSRKVRVNLSAGLALSRYRRPSNWVKDYNYNAPLAPNYNWNYQFFNTVSFVLNPRIEFPFGRIYGLNVSPLILVNPHTIYYGIGIGHLIGRLKRDL